MSGLKLLIGKTKPPTSIMEGIQLKKEMVNVLYLYIWNRLRRDEELKR